MGNCFSSERVPTTESSDHILQPFHNTQVQPYQPIPNKIQHQSNAKFCPNCNLFSSDMLLFFQVTLHGGEGGQVVTQHVHGVPVVQEVPIPAHRPLPDPLETQLGKFSQTSYLWLPLAHEQSIIFPSVLTPSACILHPIQIWHLSDLVWPNDFSKPKQDLRRPLRLRCKVNKDCFYRQLMLQSFFQDWRGPEL